MPDNVALRGGRTPSERGSGARPKEVDLSLVLLSAAAISAVCMNYKCTSACQLKGNCVAVVGDIKLVNIVRQEMWGVLDVSGAKLSSQLASDVRRNAIFNMLNDHKTYGK